MPLAIFKIFVSFVMMPETKTDITPHLQAERFSWCGLGIRTNALYQLEGQPSYF